jgi:putative ABC transport system permease protein
MVAGQARVDTVAVGDRTTGELRKQRHRLRGDAVVAAPALAGPTKGCAVLKVTLKGLLAHRARLVLTAVAVLIGVALVAGTLMLTDTIGQSVRHLTATAHAGVDVAVRNADDPKAGPPQAIGPQLLAAIRAVPGVGAAAGVVVAEKLQMVGRDGRPIRHQRAVNLVTSWPDDPMLASAYTLRQGRPPARGGEVVLDAATAGKGGWQLGDTLGIVGADGRVHRFRVVGVTGFAGRDSPASQLSSFDTPTVAVLQTAAAQRLLGRGDAVDEVDLRATPGVGAGTLRDRVAPVLPPGRLEAVTAAALAARQADQAQAYVDGLGAVLLVFAAVALLVGGFIIWNTFTVLVASRTREVALLRLLGATRRQVFGSVLGEAAVVGLVAAAGGVAAGAGAAVGLRALLRGLGTTLPPAGLVLAPRTVLVGLGVGALVTMVAALAPARRASQVAPLQAIREAASSATMPAGRAQTAVGLAVAALGAAAIAAGLALHVQSTVVAGLGALAVLVGMMALGPVLAPLLARVVGLPVTRLAGLAARLGRDNVLRNPRRSAATMGALAVGLVLAAGTGVLAASATRSVNAGIQAASNADLYLEGGLPLPAVARLVALPEVGAALPLDTGHVRVGGTRIGMDGVDPMAAARMLKLGIRAGSVRALGRPGGGLLASARLADNHGWHLGSIVPVGFTEVGATRQLPVVGVFDADRLFGSEVILPISLVERYFPLNRGMADQVLVRAAPGISPAALQTAVQTVLASHPQVTVRDGIAYQRERAGDLGDLGGALGLLTALVLLAVGIATLGIANTLALAVFERTREFGLLRAVGMTARQLAAMVCWESAIIAVSGALLGTTLGAGLGAALASAITVQQAGVATIVLPARQLLVDLALASTAGLIAATVPARRAARLNLLTAISAE